jgi:glycosyltransferase involved in cell wall biosynthesis
MSPSLVRNDYRLVPIEGASKSVKGFHFAPLAITSIQDEGPRLWKELHTEAKPSEEWLASWISKIPKYGCTCTASFREIIKDNPARFNDWKRWTWEIHNSVNLKLKKPLYSWLNIEPFPSSWKPVDGHRIGFASINYEAVGGTETFHQTLVPRLPNVIGFASRHDLHGDIDRLGVPCGQGIDAIASLALQCDTVVSWNIDWQTIPRPKRVIAVHHGSLDDAEGNRLCLQGDEIVCVNRDVAEYLSTIVDKPVHCIENAVDPDRIKPRNQVETNGKKICLWSHRFAKDKRPEIAIEIAKHLPDDWHMVLTGHRGEKLEVNERVTLLPPQHPGDWLSVASCFLSTSLFEGFGLSVAEAITAGVPVVSTATGIAQRTGCALTVSIDADPESWAVAILASQSMPLPSKDLFSVEVFLNEWQKVINTS